jgi:cell division septation protein DedD
VQATPATSQAPRLQLVAERAIASPAQPAAAVQAQSAVDAPLAPAIPASDGNRQCFSFGPFTDAAALDAARTRLQPRVTTLRARSVATTRRGWRVWLPPLADRASAQAMAARIEAAGFKDYYVIPTGADANSIALGRFGNEAAARRQQSALETAGFPAQVDALGDAAQWLDVMGSGLDAGAIRQDIGVTRSRPLDCAALAS